jgi:dCMP deaminase
MTPEWSRRFMELARFVSGWSNDPTTRVGCVIVGPMNDIRAVGFNDFPNGIRSDIAGRNEPPGKYVWMEHAERNAIYAAARSGIALQGCRIILPWFPCVNCARAIVQAGLSELIALRPDMLHPTWGNDFAVSLQLLEEANVSITWYDDPPVAGSDTPD